MARPRGGRRAGKRHYDVRVAAAGGRAPRSALGRGGWLAATWTEWDAASRGSRQVSWPPACSRAIACILAATRQGAFCDVAILMAGGVTCRSIPRTRPSSAKYIIVDSGARRFLRRSPRSKLFSPEVIEGRALRTSTPRRAWTSRIAGPSGAASRRGRAAGCALTLAVARRAAPRATSIWRRAPLETRWASPDDLFTIGTTSPPKGDAHNIYYECRRRRHPADRDGDERLFCRAHLRENPPGRRSIAAS